MKLLENLRVSRKLALAFGVLLTISIAACAVVIINLQSIQVANGRTENANAFLDTVKQAQTANVHAEGAVRALILSGDLAYIDALEAAKAEAAAAFAVLEGYELTGGDAMAEAIAVAEQSTARWLEEFTSQQLTYMMRPETVDLARAMEVSPERLDLGQQIADGFSAMSAIAHDEVVAASTQEEALLEQSFIILIVASAVLVGGAVTIGWILNRAVGVPLGKLAATTQKLAKKDWSAQVLETSRTDEIGVMNTALKTFRENGERADALEAEQRIEQERQLTRSKKIEELTASFDAEAREVLETLASSAAEMEATSRNMSDTAQETTRQASNVSSGAAEAGANVQSVSSATEELTASIREISAQIQKVSSDAAGASASANEATDQINTLAAASERVGQVVAMITEIAEQTNLLALNATIEAARAGDAGKGFAVVASEVKALANQTAKATDEIRSQIDAIQSQTTVSVSAMDAVAKSIQFVNEASASIAAAMEEQSAATDEISHSIAQASSGTEQVVSSIHGVSEGAAATGEASQHVLDVARDLSSRAARMESSVAEFLSGVRTA